MGRRGPYALHGDGAELTEAADQPLPVAAPRPLTRGQTRFLRAWAINMVLSWRTGQGTLPGFSYTADERARLSELGDGVTRSAVLAFMAAVTLAYIACAAFAVAGVIGALLLTVWRNPSKVTEPQIFAAIALIIAVMLGLVMPLSIRFGGWAAGFFWRSTAPETPADRPLYDKVSGQFRRIGVVVAVLLLVIAVAWPFVLGHT